MSEVMAAESATRKTSTLLFVDLTNTDIKHTRKCADGHIIEIELENGERIYPMRVKLDRTDGGSATVPMCITCGRIDWTAV